MNLKENMFVFGSIFLIASILFEPSGVEINLIPKAYPIEEHDSITSLIDGKTITGNNFIHLYDSTPYNIDIGHVAAHLPCDEDGESAVKVVAGVAPEVNPLNMSRVEEMSSLGTICMYHADLPQDNATSITDIALLNPTEQNVTLPDMSSIVIHVSNFTSSTEKGHHDVDEADA